MTQETIKALSDAELTQVLVWGEQEKQERASKRKQETIAKIKELAKSVEVGVKIEGTRGRPAQPKRQKDTRRGYQPKRKEKAGGQSPGF
jgi:hypothetical protein